MRPLVAVRMRSVVGKGSAKYDTRAATCSALNRPISRATTTRESVRKGLVWEASTTEPTSYSSPSNSVTMRLRSPPAVRSCNSSAKAVDNSTSSSPRNNQTPPTRLRRYRVTNNRPPPASQIRHSSVTLRNRHLKEGVTARHAPVGGLSASSNDEVQDPPSHGDWGGSPLRGLGLDRPDAVGTGRHPGQRTGQHRQH